MHDNMTMQDGSFLNITLFSNSNIRTEHKVVSKDSFKDEKL